MDQFQLKLVHYRHLVLGLYQLNCAILDRLRDRMQSWGSCKLL